VAVAHLSDHVQEAVAQEREVVASRLEALLAQSARLHTAGSAASASTTTPPPAFTKWAPATTTPHSADSPKLTQ